MPLPPSTDPPSSLRANLRLARDLLAQAGWTYRDGALRNARGDPFTIEFLDTSGSMGRVVAPYVQALERLGIQANYRIVDYAVYEKRMKQFDFEMISSRTLGRLVPGSELLQMYGSEQARTEGSSNLGGVADPVVDELLQKIMAAQTRQSSRLPCARSTGCCASATTPCRTGIRRCIAWPTARGASSSPPWCRAITSPTAGR